MSEFNREQIIKALECCGHIECPGEPCPYHPLNRCREQLRRDCYAFIKELTEERKDFEIRALSAENEAAKYKDRWETSRKDFERVADENYNLHAYYTELTQKCASWTEENERLRAEKETLEIYNADYKFKNKELMAFNRRWAKECADLQDECETIKADTVRKMQERLMQEERIFEAYGTRWKIIYSSAIDQIAKEMLGGE